LGNDRWRGEFTVEQMGECRFRIVGWRDAAATWRRDIAAKFDAGLDVDIEREEGAQIAEVAVKRAGAADARALATWVTRLRSSFDAEVRADLEQFVVAARAVLDPEDGRVVEETSPIWAERPLAG